MAKVAIPKTKSSRIGTGFLYTSLAFLVIGLFFLFTALTQGGWGALIPAATALLFGFIALVLGLVGLILKLVGRTPAATLTPEQRAQSTKNGQITFGVLAGIAGALTLFFFMSFVAPMDVVNAKYHSLDKIRASAPEGFSFPYETGSGPSIRLCNRLDNLYCNTDSDLYGEAAFSKTPLEHCQAIFKWVGHNDASTWANDYQRFKFAPNDPSAMMACTTGNLRYIAGKNGDFDWELRFDFSFGGALTLSTAPTDLGFVSDYDNFVSSFGSSDPVQSSMYRTLNDIGAWRKANPNAANSEQNILKAIKKTGLKKVQVFTDKKKNATYIAYASQGDPNQVICLSVNKFDESYFGVKDPGHGYFPIMSSYAPDPKQFGYVSQTACGQD